MSLDRFKKAQSVYYKQALSEIENGEKVSHCIWFIFPQIKGLGFSKNSLYYGIKDIQEAKEYLADKLLRERLLTISKALLKHNKSAEEIMGYIDAVKLHSCMTLFHIAEPENETFKQVLTKFYDGKLDSETLRQI